MGPRKGPSRDVQGRKSRSRKPRRDARQRGPAPPFETTRDRRAGIGIDCAADGQAPFAVLFSWIEKGILLDISLPGCYLKLTAIAQQLLIAGSFLH